MNKIRNYSIAIDAMGGDNSPKKIIDGCDIFLKENDNTNLIIFGDKSRIDNNFLEKYQLNFIC